MSEKTNLYTQAKLQRVRKNTTDPIDLMQYATPSTFILNCLDWSLLWLGAHCLPFVLIVFEAIGTASQEYIPPWNMGSQGSITTVRYTKDRSWWDLWGWLIPWALLPCIYFYFCMAVLREVVYKVRGPPPLFQKGIRRNHTTATIQYVRCRYKLAMLTNTY